MTLKRPDSVEWLHRRFEDLGPQQVHDLLHLRQQVFVIEQNCIFPEIDGLDPQCHHVLGVLDGMIVAAARIVPPEIDPAHRQQGQCPAIGRVVSASSRRGSGLGKAVMDQAILACESIFPGQPVFLNGQLYLRSFYESLGFVAFGAVFEEDGIAHISMKRPT
ncbi:MAG: GNAT family N-acetyltransferase [Pseudomonadota bacterium]